MNILLVHGFWDTGKVFRRLQNRLTAGGHRCFAPTLFPRDARLGIPDLAQKLADYADRNLPDDSPMVVVGFSMGCLVAKYYLQSLPTDRCVNAFFAISGPMRGTMTAWLYPGKGARDMRPGSKFLRELEAAAEGGFKIPVYTYYTPLDLMIIPAASSRLAQAQELMVWTPLHPWMLINGKVASDILEKLGRL